MASYLSDDDARAVKIVHAFDCKCGGRVAVKSCRFQNKWGRLNENGDKLRDVVRYYSHCLTCGEVTGWRFSVDDAVSDYSSGRVIQGTFTRSGKYVTKDLSVRK